MFELRDSGQQCEGLRNPGWFTLYFCGTDDIRWTDGILVAGISQVTGDAASYHELAVWLARGQAFSFDGIHPTALRPPLYPLFVSVFYRVFGEHQLPVFLAQTLLLLATAVVLYKWMRLDSEWFWSPAAGVICFCYPVLQAYAHVLMSETLFTFLLVLGAYYHRKEYHAEAGITLALAAMTRSIILYFPLFWLAWNLLPKRKWGNALFMLTVFCMMLTPWAMRNYDRFGVFLPVSQGGAYALWAGTHTGKYPNTADYEQFIAPYKFVDVEGEMVGNRRVMSLYLRRLPNILMDVPRRSFKFWITSHSEMLGHKFLGFVLQLSLLGFAAAGAWRSRGRENMAFPLALIAYTWMLCVFSDWGPQRYGVPMIPFLIYLGANGNL